MAKKHDKEIRKERCIAEYKTGEYTQRELSKRHGFSLGTVSNLTKGVEQSLNKVVQAQVLARQATVGVSDIELNVIQTVTEKRLQALKLDAKLDGGVSIAIDRAIELVQMPDSTMEDVERFSRAQNNLRVGLGTQEKFSNTASANVNIQNTNAQQNITPQDLMNAIKFKHSISNSRG